MARPNYIVCASNVLIQIEEIKQSYTDIGLYNEDAVYLQLVRNNIYSKFILMELILIGENCKSIQRHFEDKKYKNKRYAIVFSNMRHLRNTIAHNFYTLDIMAINDILITDIPVLEQYTRQTIADYTAAKQLKKSNHKK